MIAVVAKKINYSLIGRVLFKLHPDVAIEMENMMTQGSETDITRIFYFFQGLIQLTCQVVMKSIKGDYLQRRCCNYFILKRIASGNPFDMRTGRELYRTI